MKKIQANSNFYFSFFLLHPHNFILAHFWREIFFINGIILNCFFLWKRNYVMWMEWKFLNSTMPFRSFRWWFAFFFCEHTRKHCWTFCALKFGGKVVIVQHRDLFHVIHEKQLIVSCRSLATNDLHQRHKPDTRIHNQFIKRLNLPWVWIAIILPNKPCTRLSTLSSSNTHM